MRARHSEYAEPAAPRGDSVTVTPRAIPKAIPKVKTPIDKATPYKLDRIEAGDPDALDITYENYPDQLPSVDMNYKSTPLRRLGIASYNSHNTRDYPLYLKGKYNSWKDVCFSASGKDIYVINAAKTIDRIRIDDGKVVRRMTINKGASPTQLTQVDFTLVLSLALSEKGSPLLALDPMTLALKRHYNLDKDRLAHGNRSLKYLATPDRQRALILYQNSILLISPASGTVHSVYRRNSEQTQDRDVRRCLLSCSDFATADSYFMPNGR